MPTDFHSELKAWSQIKHRILGTYLSLFLGKLGSRGGPVYYVDGFAGQGKYDDGQHGSPLIAADIAANPVQKSRIGILKCINVEADTVTFANLERATEPYVKQGIVTNYAGTFDAVLPRVLQQVGDDTAFFFIDPFGTEGAVLSTLETLAQRSGKTEVLVRYDDTRVHRLIQWAGNNIDRLEPKFAKTAEAFIPRIAGLTDDKAIETVLQRSPEARQALIDGYLNLVKTQKLFRYGLSYPIRNPVTGGHH
jgi:three-Cys-motif partner protein